MEDLVQNDPKTPNVDLLVCSQIVLIEGFRSHIGLFPDERLSETLTVLILTPPEIPNFGTVSLGQEDVGTLQIQMDQVLGVQVPYSLANSEEEELGFVEGQGLLQGLQVLL